MIEISFTRLCVNPRDVVSIWLVTILTGTNDPDYLGSLSADLTNVSHSLQVALVRWGDPRYEDTVLKVFVAKPPGSRWV